MSGKTKLEKAYDESNRAIERKVQEELKKIQQEIDAIKQEAAKAGEGSAAG